METKQVVVLGETVTIRVMSYDEYVALAKEVVEKYVVSPTPKKFNDLALFQLFGMIMMLTSKSLMNTTKAFMQSLEKPLKGVI